MKIVEINGTNYSSTGNIALNIAKQARLEGFEVFTCCKKSRKSLEFSYENQIYIGYRIERIISEKLAEYSGYHNYFNYFGTKKFIKELESIKPDLIHLHVIHDTFINIEMLFNYIQKNNIPVVWTFHDCWAFTGRCPYFESVNCNKWKTGCFDCKQLDKYPITYCDRSKLLWNKKKDLFTRINNMTIVTPSKWLSNYISSSFLKGYETKVINNGIDLSVFKPRETEFRNKYNIVDKYVVLGVGYEWSERKGIEDFIELSKRLDDKYIIIIVGTNNEVDKKIPPNIISIHRTFNQDELVKIYSAADLFVNPTKEDNLPTVNIEALACGTPVLTYNTGGSPEIIDEVCGSVVEKNDIDSLEKEIIRICETKPYSKEACINRAKQFDAKSKYKEYVNLYKKVLEK